MSRQVTLRISSQQLGAYEVSARAMRLTLKQWAARVFLAAAGKAPKLPKSKDGVCKGSHTLRDHQVALWLPTDLEAVVDIAAEQSCIPATTWCILVLDTAAGLSNLSQYLKRVF